LLVVTHQGHDVFGVVLVGDRYRGAEPHPAFVWRLRWIDNPRGLEPAREEGEFAIDLAHALAPVYVVAVLAAIAIARGPAHHGHDLRSLGAEQMVIAGAQGS